ncbi:ABC transporter permease subunit [Acetobacterium tundrae]|uniref:ABC transporter permease subunit n=1 Tax=Acetobacterium tundrae TaxID=132932 RepID=A0ABR6WH49_9FIRM|nr:ABC transporter permease subunit [Acetobacterium tundrae]MBC3795551.1 ABC transporter permease subunit [Acetobacterium tundrae]
MSIPLFLKDIKDNIFLLLIFVFLMSLYLGVIIYMYDPNGVGALVDMLSLLPVALVKAMRLSTIDSGLTGFIGSLFYGIIIYLFPMVYCIILGNRLVAKWVNDGSFACLLTTPNSRVKIIVTQGIYMVFSIIVLFSVLFLVGLAVSGYCFPGTLDKSVFFELNLCACLLTITVGMICFFFSCLFNDTTLSLGFGAGILIIFFLFTILSGISDLTAFLGKYSLYNAFNSLAIVKGEANIVTICVGFLTISLLLFAAGVGAFGIKRLPV